MADDRTGTFDAVLFDAGDTLIRLSGSGEQLLHEAATGLGAGSLEPSAVSAVWRTVLERSGQPGELAKGRDLSTDRHREVWTALYRSAGCDHLVPGLSDQLYRLTIRATSWEAFPDTVSTLAALNRRGLRIGIVSDTGFDLRPVLDRLGVTAQVHTTVMSFELGECKPATSVFLAACRQLGVAPDRTLMVGDNPLTDSGAVNAGLHVLLLPRPARSGPRGLDHVLSLTDPRRC